MSEQNSGRVYWVTGLPGAGKTTVAQAMQSELASEGVNGLILDGDALREVLQRTDEHDPTARKELARTYSRLCALIAGQGINVICATVSMFDDVRNWNRSNIPRYVEVYLKASVETLMRRDKKGIYGRAISGEQDNVLGINAAFEEPRSPDMTISADDEQSPAELASSILRAFPPLSVQVKLESER